MCLYVWCNLKHMPLIRVADVPGRRALRSANTDCLTVPHVRLLSVGNRAFPVAASCVWNNLPSEVISAQSLHSFRATSQNILVSSIFSRRHHDTLVDPAIVLFY